MKKWKHEIHGVKDILLTEDENECSLPYKEVSRLLYKLLRSNLVLVEYNKEASYPVKSLPNFTYEEEVGYFIDELYDWADDNDVWIG